MQQWMGQGADGKSGVLAFQLWRGLLPHGKACGEEQERSQAQHVARLWHRNSFNVVCVTRYLEPRRA